MIRLWSTVALARTHHTVGGHPLARGDQQAIAWAKRMRRHLASRPVRLDQCGDAALEAQQILRFAPRTHAQRFIEKAPDQQEEQQRDGGIEIDLLAAEHGLIEAHAGREQNGK